MPEDETLSSIDNILNGTQAETMPNSTIMIDKALEILGQSPIAFPLVKLVETENINIHVLNTLKENSYVPEKKAIYIGVTSFDPTGPARFVLLLADALIDVKLEIDGPKQPVPTEQKESYIAKTAEKSATKIAELCTIAFDLDQKEQFSGYNFIDEMHKMGHNKAMDVFINNI